MSYIYLSNYKFGLDTRRSELSSQPGTLLQLNNAHVTQGGEIEKRQAFVKYRLPEGTFGLLSTSTNIYIFGSRVSLSYTSTSFLVAANTAVIFFDNDNGYPLQVGDMVNVSGMSDNAINGQNFTIASYAGSPSFAITYPVVAPDQGFTFDTGGTMQLAILSSIIYQRLVHPLGASMTGVVTATLFADKPFVVATFDNGDTLAYYDGTLITDFIYGEQGSLSRTAFAVANNLVSQINATGLYTTIAPTFPAFLSFQVTAGSAGIGNVIGAIQYNFGRLVNLPTLDSNTFQLTTANVLWNISNAQTATDVATAINTNPYGFVATPIGNTVEIVPPATDVDGNPLTVSDTDTLSVSPAGNVQVFVPPNTATFSIISIPSESSANPFTVATTVQDANLAFRLVSNGVPATAPANAVGQFTIIAGSGNNSATGTLTLVAGVPLNNDVVIVGDTSYTYVTFLTGFANEILIGATGTASVNNLIAAVNGTVGAGSTYSIGTTANTQVSSSTIVGGIVTFTATVGGTGGNAIVTTTTSAFATWGAGTLAGGGPDTNKINQITVGGTNLLTAAVVFNTNVSQTANDVVTAINAFSGTSGFTATASSGIITLTAANAGATFNESVVAVQCAGNVCIANCFFVVSGVATENVSAMSANGTPLMSATITFKDGAHPTETIGQFCARVVANVNLNTGFSGYLAFSIGSQVNISAATVSSADVPVDIEVTATMQINQGATTVLSVTNNTNNVTFTETSGIGKRIVTAQSNNSPSSAVVVVSGGVPPYNYNWSIISGTTVTIPQLTGQQNQWWTISTGSKINSTVEQWVCTITDSQQPAPTTVISPIFYLNIPQLNPNF